MDASEIGAILHHLAAYGAARTHEELAALKARIDRATGAAGDDHKGDDSDA